MNTKVTDLNSQAKPLSVRAEAEKQVQGEIFNKAKDALVKKLRDLANAQQIVKNIERDISDLEASLADGSFAG